ncbi:PHB depolymerase family esterase [Marvinbryantia sp.]|uniref:PHB depolymerase family esterase n=1 Tax=Marvinbryantia sp. TaxID=2496532 RepID=UPI002665FDC5|nr:PHB depolymerase family esterase [uncultured Marvinbryantia sp.]
MEKPIMRKFPQKMADIPIDFAHPNQTLMQGCFEETAAVNGESRSFLTYIPEKLEYCQPCLIVAPPAGVDPAEYMEESGLKKLADDKRLFLFLLKADPFGWKYDGSDADYMNAVYTEVQSRNYYVTMQDNIYACGIGDGAAIAHQAVQKMASEWSGLFSFGTIGVNLRESSECTAENAEQNGTELRIEAAKCQVPVWMTFADLEDGFNLQAVDYWKEQNHVTDDPLKGQGADLIWMPSPVKRFSEVNEEQIAQVRVTLDAGEVTLGRLEKVWNYIGMARRHRSFTRKNLRYYREPLACGAVLQERVFEGMNRLWYEYVPESCTADQKWPLVVVMHGRGGTAESFFDISAMSVVAEARRFLVVFPQAGIHQQKPDGLKNVLYWNGSYEGRPVNDVAFIRSLVEDVAKRLPVDRKRIYACGQSSGGIMTDVLCGSAGDLFAACGSWSGMYHPRKVHGTYEKTEDVVPTLFICGNKDRFCTAETEDEEFPFSLIPELRKDIVEKIERYHLDKNHVQTWTTWPITWYSYPNSQGIPLLTVGIVSDMAHANYPEESWITYDQFFSQFAKDEDGNLCYRGEKVLI